MKHLLVVAVAVAYVAVSLANGGYSHELIAGAAIVIWWAVAVALIFRLGPASRVSGTAIAAGLLLAAFGAWTAISISWASDDGAAFVEAVRVLSYLGLFALVLIVSPRASARYWLSGLALGIVVVACVALASRFEPSFGAQHAIGRFLPVARGRLTYPIGYWGGLGAIMAMGAVLLVWLGAHAKTLAARALAVATIPLPILTIYYASSRGGVAAGVVGLAALVLLGPARERLLACLALGGAGGAGLILLASDRSELLDGFTNPTAAGQGDQMLVFTVLIVAGVGVTRVVLDRPFARFALPRPVIPVAVIAVAVAVAVAVVAIHPAARWREFKSVPPTEAKNGHISAHLTSGIGSGRYQFWSAALHAFGSEPLRGIGAGGYEAYWNQHGSLALPVRDAHELYIETMAELGIVGLILLLGFLGVAAGSGFARGPTRWPGGELGACLALLATGLTSAALDWTWELPACFGPVIVAAALLTGPAMAFPERGRFLSQARHAPGGSRLVLVATGVVAVVAIGAAGILFLNQLKIGDSQDAVDRGDLVSAADDARDAVAIEPWSSDARLQLALVEELGGDYHAAIQDVDAAIDRAPDNWQPWFVKARLEVKAANGHAAHLALARARELNPRAPFLATEQPPGS
jgi:O-Antigen ligase